MITLSLCYRVHFKHVTHPRLPISPTLSLFMGVLFLRKADAPQFFQILALLSDLSGVSTHSDLPGLSIANDLKKAPSTKINFWLLSEDMMLNSFVFRPRGQEEETTESDLIYPHRTTKMIESRGIPKPLQLRILMRGIDSNHLAVNAAHAI